MGTLDLILNTSEEPSRGRNGKGSETRTVDCEKESLLKFAQTLAHGSLFWSTPSRIRSKSSWVCQRPG